MRYSLKETCIVINECQKRYRISQVFKEIGRNWYKAYGKAASVGSLLDSHHSVYTRNKIALQTTTLCDIEKFGEELKKTVEKYKDFESPFGDPPARGLSYKITCMDDACGFWRPWEEGLMDDHKA